MPRGGLRNPKGGRPLGAKDKIPRASRDDDRIKQFVAEVENAEFFVTDPQTKVYKGNSRELMVDIYKAEQVPLKYRMYAAAKMIEYEAVRDEIAGVPRPDAGEALIAAINRLRDTEDEPKGPPPQIMPPALPKQTVRRKPASPVIDGDTEPPSAELGAKSGGNASVGAHAEHSAHVPTHTSEPDGQHSGADSEPESSRELTQREWADRAAVQTFPHLRRS